MLTSTKSGGTTITYIKTGTEGDGGRTSGDGGRAPTPTPTPTPTPSKPTTTSKGTYNPETGTYTDPSGQSYSMAAAEVPEGTKPVFENGGRRRKSVTEKGFVLEPEKKPEEPTIFLREGEAKEFGVESYGFSTYKEAPLTRGERAREFASSFYQIGMDEGEKIIPFKESELQFERESSFRTGLEFAREKFNLGKPITVVPETSFVGVLAGGEITMGDISKVYTEEIPAALSKTKPVILFSPSPLFETPEITTSRLKFFSKSIGGFLPTTRGELLIDVASCNF